MTTTFSLQDIFELKQLLNNFSAKLSTRIENGIKQLLAIITTEGDILLYYNYGELKPILKRITWYTDSNKSIEALCFDPSATWLLVICIDGSLHIIPALNLVDKKQKIDCKWSISDTTHFPKHNLAPDSKPTSIVWWQTSDSNQNAIVGYENSRIALISLTDGRCLCCCGIAEPVKELILCQDASLDCVSLLINDDTGYQWRLILETHSTGYVWSSETTQNDDQPHSKLQNLKQMGVDKLTSLKQRLNEARGGTRRDSHSSDSTSESSTIEPTATTIAKCVPERLPHMSNTFFAPQHARNRYLFSVFYKPNCLLTVHSTNVDCAPMYVYKLPEGTTTILLTDRLIYTTNDEDGVVCVISTHYAECNLEEVTDFTKKSLIAQYQLPNKNEKVLNVYKLTDKVLPKERSRDSESSTNILSRSYQELNSEKIKVDTCVIVTTAGVYKIRIKYSLVNLFIKLVVENWDLELAESVAVVFGLNSQKLLEASGDLLISNGSYHKGLILYMEAKVHILKRVLKFAMVSDCENLLKFVNICLNVGKVDMSIATKIHIGNLAVMAYTELILRYNGETRNENTKQFMQFLCHEEYYDQVLAVNVACQAGLWNVVTLLAKTRGLQLEVVSTLSQILQTTRAPRFNDDEFLITLSEPSLTQSLILHSKACHVILNHIRNYYKNFSINVLRRFLIQLDPSQPTVLPIMNSLSKRKLNSSSLDTTLDSTIDFDNSDLLVVMKDFIETFILLLVEVVNLTEENTYNMCLLDAIESPEIQQSSATIERQLAKYPEFHPLSCGHEHAAIVRNGNVYTMGMSSSGRLGIGPLLTPNSSPVLVQTLKDMRLRVFSVSCGRKHTLTLTEFGVYAWGSNKYGQLGLGPVVQESPYPQVISALSGIEIVDIVAGQYHSVALTSTGRVYTWGWGIHGQLGHSTYDNQYYPKLLQEECPPAQQIAAGHAHTLLLFENYVAGFGSNAFLQLTEFVNKKVNKLTKLDVPVNEHIKPITCIASSYFHNIAVFSNNEVYAWGSNPHELKASHSKNKYKVNTINSPVRVYSGENQKPIELISIGYNHCAIIHNGKILWGKSKEGKLNYAAFQDEEKCGLFDQKYVHVSCGLDYRMALEQSGKLLAWGNSKMAQIILGKSFENERNSDERILICRNTKRLVKLSPYNPEFENGAVEIPGLPSMEIIYDTYNHSSLFSKKNYVPNAVKLIENEMVSKEYECYKTAHKKSQTFDFINETPFYKYGQKTLHYALETYFGYYDSDNIISKCGDVNNFQAISKIAMLDGHFGDSLSFQLKAFKNYLDKYTLEYNAKIITKPSFDAKHNDLNKHIELHSIKINDLNNEINSPVQMLSTSSSLDSIRQWGDDLEHQGGCESPCELSDIGDVRQSMTQYLLSINNPSNPISSVSKIISNEQNIVLNKRQPEIEYHIIDVKMKELVNTASQIVEFYIKKTYAFENHILMQNILMICIDFWLTNNLPVFALEKILLKNMDKYFYPLSILLFCKNFTNNLNDELEKNDEYKSVGFLKEFSTKFCLQLCSMVLENVSKQ